jgi:hypothetical protein
MSYIANIHARERLQHLAHPLAEGVTYIANHAPHAPEAVVIRRAGFTFAFFLSRLLFLFSMNDFSTGLNLVVSAVKGLVRLDRARITGGSVPKNAISDPANLRL